jgi:hypothetical protein
VRDLLGVERVLAGERLPRKRDDEDAEEEDGEAVLPQETHQLCVAPTIV